MDLQMIHGPPDRTAPAGSGQTVISIWLPSIPSTLLS